MRLCKQEGCAEQFKPEKGYRYCPLHRGRRASKARYKQTPAGKKSVNLASAKRYREKKKTVKPCEDCGLRPKKGRSPRCQTCIRLRDAERIVKWREGNPKARMNARVRLYGISAADYINRLEAQGGKCAVCRTDFPGREGTWPIDHDGDCCSIDYCNYGNPACGKCFRGLLCYSCNSGLGYLKHDLGILLAAVDYLKTYKEKRNAGN